MSIYLSANKKIINKNNNKENLAHHWQQVKIENGSALERVLSKGIAVCTAVLHDNYREDGNFISSQLIAVDLDEGPDVTYFATVDEFTKKYAALVCSTVRSTVEKPRTRVYFILDTVVSDGTQYKHLVERLLSRFKYFNVDTQCSSCTQIFYGNNKGQYVALNNILPLTVLQALSQPTQPASASSYDYSAITIEFNEDKRPTADILVTGTQNGKRNHDAVQLVTKYINVLPPVEVEAILRLWYDTLPDKTDFDFLEVQKVIRHYDKKSKGVRDRIHTETIKALKKPDPPSKTQLSQLVTSFAGMMAEDEEIKWLIKDWLPESTTALMVAPPESYKTWLALAMAMSIGMGRPFLDNFACSQQRRVLVMQQEDAKSITAARSRLLFAQQCLLDDPPQQVGEVLDTGIIVPQVDYYTTDHTFKFDDEKAMANLAALIHEMQYAVIIIDPLYSASNSEDYMSKDAQRMTELKRIRDKTGAAFLLLHHTKKQTTPVTRDSPKANRLDIWGSQFLNAWLETGIQIRSTDDPKSKSVSRHFKNNSRPYNDVLTFDINTDPENGPDRFKILFNDKPLAEGQEEAVHGKPNNSRPIDVYAILGSGAMTISEFARKAGLPNATASRKVKKLLDSGVIHKQADGLIALTDIEFKR